MPVRKLGPGAPALHTETDQHLLTTVYHRLIETATPLRKKAAAAAEDLTVLRIIAANPPSTQKILLKGSFAEAFHRQKNQTAPKRGRLGLIMPNAQASM